MGWMVRCFGCLCLVGLLVVGGDVGGFVAYACFGVV